MRKTSGTRTVLRALFAVLLLAGISGEASAQSWLKTQPQPNQPKVSQMPNLKPMPNQPMVKPLPKWQPNVSPIPNPNLKPMPKPPAFPNPKPQPKPGWNHPHHDSHHGGNFGFFVAPPSGHYETITETIMVEPERVEQFWVPPEYNTVTDASGNQQVVKVRDGYLAERIIPARYEMVTRQVWVQHGGPNFGFGLGFKF